MTWTNLLANWSAIECDLLQVYGVDVADVTVMHGRSWHWLKVKVWGLLDVSPGFTPDGRRMMATRLGRTLYPTDPPNRS